MTGKIPRNCAHHTARAQSKENRGSPPNPREREKVNSFSVAKVSNIRFSGSPVNALQMQRLEAKSA